MTRQVLWIATLMAGFGQAVLGPPLLADETQSGQSEQDIQQSLEKIVFVPHDVDAPKVTDAGGVRGIASAPKLLVLAPERLSLSRSPTPTLYWYMSKGTETPVRFTLLADDPLIVNPLLEIELGTFAGPGIYSVSLAQHNIRLKEKHRYSWSVTVSSEDSAATEDPVAQTWLEHSLSATLDPFLATSSPLNQTAELAEKGYWYDAINVVSHQIEAGNQSTPWREVRARLLDQVGLQHAAVFDRRQNDQ